jgi:acetate---CoA ligase (ADP-forming)
MRDGRDLTRLFRPASVAVVGASDDPTRIGGRVLRNLTVHGYEGEIIPVNPKSRTVQGRAAAHSVDVIAPVDLAVLAVNAEQTVDVLRRMVEAGTRSFVALATGEISEQITTILEPHRDACLLGPNSNGLWSVAHHLIASFGGEADRNQIDDGPVAIISHSGSLGGAVARRLEDEKIGLRYLVSLGNEADLSLVDVLDFVVADPAIRVIGAYIEGVRHGAVLLDAIARARRRGVQVVIQLAGRSRLAQLTTMSHTGKALSSPVVAREVLRERGALVVDTTADLIDACRYATASVEPMVPRIGALGISGGMLASIADACDAADLPFARLAEATLAKLRTLLPGFSEAGNPVDVTGAVLNRAELLSECAEAVADDPSVDALVIGLDNKGYERVRSGDWLVRLAQTARKPVAVVLWDRPEGRDIDLERSLLTCGVAVVSEPSSVASALRRMCRSNQAEAGEPMPNRPWSRPNAMNLGDELRSWPGQRAFAEVLGLRAPRTVVTDSGAGLPPLGDLAYPAVVKPLPVNVQHKTDSGLVHLRLADRVAVERAVSEVRRVVGTEVPVVVQEMVGGVEVLLAASRDPDWGPILTVGFGGTLVEVVKDLVTVPMPSDGPKILRALRQTRVWTLLEGFRGAPRTDVTALIDAALRLQDVFLANDLEEIELNPLIVGAAGEGTWMVDLLVTWPAQARDAL